MLFKYKAKNKEGEVKEGIEEFASQVDLARKLRAEDFYIVEVEQKDTGKKGFSLKKAGSLDINVILEKIKGVSLEEKMMFSRNLAVMIESGINLTRSLDVLQRQTKSPTFKKAIIDIASQVKRGVNFSEAITSYSKIFSRLYSSMVKVGEATGNLGETLNILAEQLEKQHELRSKIKGAMTYPIVIMVAMTIVGILMMVTIVPQLEKVFNDLGIDLPPTTEFVLLLSNIIKKFWWAIFTSLPFMFYAMFKYFKTETGSKTLAWILMHTPVFKTLVKKINNAAFSRNLGSLISGGVPILEGLEITSDTLSNFFYKNSIKNIIDKIRGGGSLSMALERYPHLFTPLMIEMIQVGEEAGKLANLLDKVAQFYEGEVSDTTANMSSIVEPILMIFIGSVVGFFAVSIMQPIYGMLGSL